MFPDRQLWEKKLIIIIIIIINVVILMTMSRERYQGTLQSPNNSGGG